LKTLDLLHRWIGGLMGLVLAVLGFSGALLVHKDAWVFLPHGSGSAGQSGGCADRRADHGRPR
jgi:hypothetical protein